MPLPRWLLEEMGRQRLAEQREAERITRRYPRATARCLLWRRAAGRPVAGVARTAISLLALLLPLAGCGDPGGLVSRSIFTQAAQGPGTRVNIVELMPFAFDSLWIFPPDAHAQAIRDSLGGAATELADDRLSAPGDSTLLVFVRGGRVVFAVRHPRDHGAFHPETMYRGIPVDETSFVVDSASPPGRPILRSGGAAAPP